jgi:predicted ester cyclase
MPAPEHVHLIEQIADGFNTGALDAITRLVSPSLAGFTRDLALLRQAFPDARFTIEDILADGDKLADRYTISGTHARPFLGIATGRQIHLAGISIVLISGGRIAERWAVTDQLGLLRQLGTLPASPRDEPARPRTRRTAAYPEKEARSCLPVSGSLTSSC